MDAARGASFAADQDEGPQRGSGRPIPPLVSKIQVATTNAGARAQGGLTPGFLALSERNPKPGTSPTPFASQSNTEAKIHGTDERRFHTARPRICCECFSHRSVE